VWPGTSKLLEEQGELIQVLGKLMGSAGDPKHWSGDLRKMLVEEIGDVYAALEFFIHHNLTDAESIAISQRLREKNAVFENWHASHSRVGR
jgi:NTP pyrophosphatase (non-canonical NTP hydrolase)